MLFDMGSSYGVGEPVTDEDIARAEAVLGVRLPTAYVEALRVRNGGMLAKRCLRTDFASSWASDHVAIDLLVGIGGEMGIDGPCGSRYMIEEWGYPDVGVVLFGTPSAGHDTVMLDYRECGPTGEPSVVYVDEDRVPRRIADSVADLFDRLEPSESFPLEEDGE